MAATESVIQITDAAAATKYLHTQSRSYSGTTKEDQLFLKAYPTRVTYRAYASAVITTTSASHLIFIQADGTNYTFINGLYIKQTTLAGAAATANIQLVRTSTAGTGGGAISAYPMDASDTSPYGGTIQTLPTAKGTEGVTLDGFPVALVAAQPMDTRNQYFYRFDDDEKGIVIGTATTDGIAVKLITGIATSKFDLTLELTVAAQK
jgi:hypothetical protein